MAAVNERGVYGKCPLYDGDIYAGDKNWYSSNFDAKKFRARLPKRIIGVQVRNPEARNFFGGKLETQDMGGVKKDGNKVKFKLAYDDETKNVFVGPKSYFCSGFTKDEYQMGFKLTLEGDGKGNLIEIK